jgi:peptidoglycan hydrolase-like protein with peptidoglycan-binding domain
MTRLLRNSLLAAVFVAAAVLAGPLSAQETAPQDPAKMPEAEVAKVQQALRQQGYDPGAVDGTWGQQSAEALKDFQTNRAIPTSHGLIDSTTLHALHVAASQ